MSLGQRIRIRVSSAKGDVNEPLNADIDTEIGSFEVALVFLDAGGVTVDITGDMNRLNPAGPRSPERDAFVRVIGAFEYDNGPDAALGPFGTIDSVTISFIFN